MLVFESRNYLVTFLWQHGKGFARLMPRSASIRAGLSFSGGENCRNLLLHEFIK